MDDDPINRQAIATLLKGLKLRVTAVSGGKEALDQFGAALDLILMDCNMPEIDGYEATRRWRALEQQDTGSSIPILALTAHSLEENRQKCKDAGMNRMLTKPITAAQLDQVIRHALSD